MPIRPRRVIPQSVVVIVGILILAGLIGVTVWTTWLVNHRQNTAEQNAADYAKSAEASIQQNCAIADLAARQECRQEKIRAAGEAQRSEYDLAAQQDVADWTQLAVYVGVASILVGVGGIVVVWMSLKQGRQGLEQGRRGVMAAEAATVVSREMGQRQLRAYVFCEEQVIEWDGDDISCINFKWKNCGQSPAKIEKSRCYVMIVRPAKLADEITADEFASVLPAVAQQTMNQVAPGGSFVVKTRRITGKELDDWQAGHLAILLHASLRYTDVFDKPRFTKVCVRLVYDETDKHMITHFEIFRLGNRAN